MTTLDDALTDTTRLGFDTSPIIYFVEAHPRYGAVVQALFHRLESGSVSAVTSVVTLCEVLTQPIQKGNEVLQREYYHLLVTSGHFELRPICAYEAERAAELRGRYGLRTPDAIQLAVALNAGCEAFVTNDAALKRVSELRILLVDELM